MVEAREVTYPADGLVMRGRLARPDGEGPWPAVLIGHEGPGLNEYSARRADALAEEGYLALAMDIHGGRWFADATEMMARLEPLLAEPGADPDRAAAVGHGTGGTIAMELARAGTDLRAAYQAEMQAGGVDWRLNVYGGAWHAFHHPPVHPDGSLQDDPSQPVVNGVGYHRRHAERAWRDVLDLLAEVFDRRR